MLTTKLTEMKHSILLTAGKDFQWDDAETYLEKRKGNLRHLHWQDGVILAYEGRFEGAAM